MRIILISFILLLSLDLIAVSDISLFKNTDFKSIDFVQTRYIKASDITLESSGTIVFVDKNELLWKQKSPFPNTIIMSPTQVFTLEGDKRVEIKNPIVHQVSKVLTGLINGKTEGLSDKFKINKSKTGNEVLLNPSDELIKKVIVDIKLTGKEQIERFELREVSGNSMKINFSNHIKDNMK